MKINNYKKTLLVSSLLIVSNYIQAEHLNSEEKTRLLKEINFSKYINITPANNQKFFYLIDYEYSDNILNHRLESPTLLDKDINFRYIPIKTRNLKNKLQVICLNYNQNVINPSKNREKCLTIHSQVTTLENLLPIMIANNEDNVILFNKVNYAMINQYFRQFNAKKAESINISIVKYQDNKSHEINYKINSNRPSKIDLYLYLDNNLKNNILSINEIFKYYVRKPRVFTLYFNLNFSIFDKFKQKFYFFINDWWSYNVYKIDNKFKDLPESNNTSSILMFYNKYTDQIRKQKIVDNRMSVFLNFYSKQTKINTIDKYNLNKTMKLNNINNNESTPPLKFNKKHNPKVVKYKALSKSVLPNGDITYYNTPPLIKKVNINWKGQQPPIKVKITGSSAIDPEISIMNN